MTIFIIEVSLDGGKQWVPTSHPYYTPEKARKSLDARNKEAARWKKTSGTASHLHRIGIYRRDDFATAAEENA